MRKTEKKQAEEFLKILRQAHDELRKRMQDGKHLSEQPADIIESLLGILEDCQQGAIQLGNRIEESEGEGFPAVSLLEKYCEQIYQIYQIFQQLTRESTQAAVLYTNKAFKHLQKLLIAIENSVKNDIPKRLEAVFLPYKASMWDSLESVWMAANRDENCDAYVIPIPYYDKNPDGSFREMHYEGDQYPEYVPVTRYEDYDFAKRQPDMIFIHNPYDEYNYVTSVEPFFYSKNLRQYTKKLIYIPYFILDESSPDDTAAVNGMKHFCTTPGVVNADKVIVQSEDMRQIYINVLTREVSGTEKRRGYWEAKIEGIGSPKMDKVLSARREDYL